MEVSYNVHWDAETGLSDRSVIPPEDDIDAFLHRIRPFVLQKDKDTYFPNVCDILSRYLKHSQLRASIQRQRDRFLGKEFQSKVQIMSNEAILNTDETLKNWLNAFEYHRDVPKQEELKTLHQILPLESSRALFVGMIVVNKAATVFEIARIVRTLERCQGTQITVRA
jgi:hypothetical protein